MTVREDATVPRAFNDYGPKMREFLLRATNGGVELDDPIATALLSRERGTRAEALKSAGLIHQRVSKKGKTTWRATDAGRALAMEHTPVFLHRHGFPSYTTKTWQAMFGEPETMDYAA